MLSNFDVEVPTSFAILRVLALAGQYLGAVGVQGAAEGGEEGVDEELVGGSAYDAA
jgi:hypothetical protein